MASRASIFSAAVLLLGLAPGAAVAGPFDGSWSVLIVTQQGQCDSYRYAVNIKDGTVVLAEDAPVTLSGRVEGSGAVKVNVRRGNQRADGSGRLSGNRGSGSWTGRTPTSECAGRWEAERR